jgi:hypothetical protein
MEISETTQEKIIQSIPESDAWQLKQRLDEFLTGKHDELIDEARTLGGVAGVITGLALWPIAMSQGLKEGGGFGGAVMSFPVLGGVGALIGSVAGERLAKGSTGQSFVRAENNKDIAEFLRSECGIQPNK